MFENPTVYFRNAIIIVFALYQNNCDVLSYLMLDILLNPLHVLSILSDMMVQEGNKFVHVVLHARIQRIINSRSKPKLNLTLKSMLTQRCYKTDFNHVHLCEIFSDPLYTCSVLRYHPSYLFYYLRDHTKLPLSFFTSIIYIRL